MSSETKDWTERVRKGLNTLVDRITDFEAQGGVTGAVQRSVDRIRQEQERMRDAGMHGPLAYHARIRQAYARLELPYGAPLDDVRTSYRRLMRRYHPDRHTDNAEKEQLATEIAQKLTAAYDLLTDHLRR